MNASKKYSKPVILLCAYNEEENIGRTVDLILRTRVNAEILVVNDGSTDKTGEIAAQKGARVINFKENRGKASAFFAGIKHALRMNSFIPLAVVTLDADMLAVPRDDLRTLIARAANASLRKNPIWPWPGSANFPKAHSL